MHHRVKPWQPCHNRSRLCVKSLRRFSKIVYTRDCHWASPATRTVREKRNFLTSLGGNRWRDCRPTWHKHNNDLKGLMHLEWSSKGVWCRQLSLDASPTQWRPGLCRPNPLRIFPLRAGYSKIHLSDTKITWDHEWKRERIIKKSWSSGWESIHPIQNELSLKL